MPRKDKNICLHTSFSAHFLSIAAVAMPTKRGERQTTLTSIFYMK